MNTTNTLKVIQIGVAGPEGTLEADALAPGEAFVILTGDLDAARHAAGFLYEDVHLKAAGGDDD